MKSLIDELIEDTKKDKKILKSFKIKDSLSTDIFESKDGEFVMRKEIKDRLIEITETFMDFVDVEMFIHYIILTGSLANYNWSEYSDVDLHILVDFDEFNGSKSSDNSGIQSIIKNFFDTKRSLWNKSHEITIKGFDCEIYVQDVNEKHLSSGVYSVLNGEWVVKPEKTTQHIDGRKILDKGADYAKMIDNVELKSKNGEDVNIDIKVIKDKLKKFRQAGLDKGGEFSYENLTFKLLRRNGYIGKLLDVQTKTTDKKLSIEQ